MENTRVEVKKELNLRLIVLILAAAVLVYPLVSKVPKVEKAIENIGTVTLLSEEAIAAAEEAYAALTEEQQEKVENYDTLVAARSEYESLVVEEAIDLIGKVNLDSEAAITHAEALYDALTESQKALVDNYKTMSAARKSYHSMVSAVQKVKDTVDAIGTVTLDSGDKITAAREAYDALEALEKKTGADLKSAVSGKLTVLTQAEADYAECAAGAEYESAMKLFDARNYTQALEAFRNLAKNWPDTSRASQARDQAFQCSLKLAEAAHTKGDQYEAMRLLKEADSAYTDTEAYKTMLDKIIKRLEGSRPSNGAKFSDKIAWGWCELRVTASSQDLCVKVVSKDDKSKFTMFYVRSGETASVKLENGTYDVYYTYGEHWFDKTHGFGDNAGYKGIVGQLTLNSWIDGSYVYYYRYDLDLKNSGNSDLTTDSSSAMEFWG